MSHYHDSDDLRFLGEIKTLAPADFAGFVALDKVVSRGDGAIPIAAALRAGAAVTHGALALKLFDQVKGDQR